MATPVSSPDPTDGRNNVGWTCQLLNNGVSYSYGYYQPEANKPTIVSNTTLSGTAQPAAQDD
jgi:hypothetical protein